MMTQDNTKYVKH